MHIVLVKGDRKAREKPCLRCGYSLRKNFDAKYCPECGLSVWLSLSANDGLDWSSPPWLTRLAIASLVMAVAQLLGLVAYVGLLLAAYGDWFHALHISAEKVDVLSGFGAAYTLLAAVAMLILASNENRHPDRWRRYKWAIRIIAGLGILEGIATTMWLLSIPFGLRVEFHHYGVQFFVLASVISTLAYLRKLAQRAHNSTLSRLSGFLLLGSALSLLKAVPVVWFILPVQLILTLLPMVFLPMTCGLLVWFAIVFRKSSITAQQGWDSETAGDEPAPHAAPV